MKREKIVCAAVRFYKDDFDDKGVIVAGINHEHCDQIYNDITSLGYVDCDEGYLTNNSSFVNKYEAMSVAIKSGQYPNYALMKRKGLELIEEMREKNMLDAISEVEDRNKELDQLMERKYLLPEDLY